jgi:hypothetical protein
VHLVAQSTDFYEHIHRHASHTLWPGSWFAAAQRKIDALKSRRRTILQRRLAVGLVAGRHAPRSRIEHRRPATTRTSLSECWRHLAFVSTKSTASNVQKLYENAMGASLRRTEMLGAGRAWPKKRRR